MAKALGDIHHISHADAMIEVVDARAIITSSNIELTQKFNKPKLTIALKKDLANLKSAKNNSHTLIGSIKDKKFKNQIIDKLNEIFFAKKESLKRRGLINPEFHIIVVGLPNVGKSSLINFLSSRNKLVVANRPGVTRNKQLVRINDNYLLYDTPGVLIKKIVQPEDGYKLALIGVIKKEILPLNEVVEWGFTYLSKYYEDSFRKRYNFLAPFDFNNFLNFICLKYQFLSKDLHPNKDRAMEYLYKDWINNFKVNYEEKI
ncbi:MAG: 50S ribosome-binding GTPase [Mycoplasmataceae bacterium]|nr:50S ribosome-binding GTPase [Mycoplasmataceae bacterium]